MTEVGSNGPAPSRHVFISELARLAIGVKVRFLGWYVRESFPFDDIAKTILSVLGYNETTGHLLVEHIYPPDASFTNTLVNMTVAQQSTDSTCFEIGTWINVIGSIEVSASGKRKRKRKPGDSSTNKDYQRVIVGAVLVWTAGAIRVAEYEKILEEQREARNLAAAAQVQFL